MADSPTELLFPELARPPLATGHLFAQVVFNRPLDDRFTYAVPEKLADVIVAGKRVLAPFGRGNRPTIGYCVELSTAQPDRRVKEVSRVLDAEALLTPALLRLTRWMADYYLCSWGQVLDAVVPAGAKDQAGTRERVFVQALTEAALPQPLAKLTPRQDNVLTLLRRNGQPQEVSYVARKTGCTAATVLALVKKGYAIRSLQRVEQSGPAAADEPEQPALALNADQARTLSAIEVALQSPKFQPFLLHGVTGSGKTEVYLQAIEQVVRQGKEAIVLVPEISLTPQTIQRFRGRFQYVAVLHSHLRDAERGRYWRQIASGEAQVIVGARSAVFAPTRRLGLIVIDEEHENSFKQETTPRYHARDVAVVRAQLEQIPIVLGSATPALESWHNAQSGRYQLLSLPTRVLDRPLPAVHLLDLRHERPSRGRYRAISPSLEEAMKRALAAGGQIILLLNRRGYSTYLCCPSCGEVVKCKYCDVALTHHQDREVVMCHHCGYEQEPPQRCPACGLAQLSYLGQGTEKLEAEIAHKFPGVPAQRMDSDSMRRPGSHRKAFEAFRKGEVKILLGTQMIAKGLDFPNVTLVGVVHADIALYLPDFRSAERTFQLLAQVAGRTGRGPSGGKVLVQTHNPEHPCIHLATQHDYLAFAKLELEQRKAHSYPPFARMARIILRSKNEQAVEKHAESLAEAFRHSLSAGAGTRRAHAGLRVLGPAPAPLGKLKNYFRWHFQLQCPSAAVLHEVLSETLRTFPKREDVDWSIDVDPQSML
jgi:primosomal protein N' (replication factor Y)